MKVYFVLCLLFLAPSGIHELSKASPLQDNGRYLEAGIPNDRHFERWFKKFQQYVKTDNREKVADFIKFPLDVRINKIDMKMKTRKDFLENYRLLFTKEVKEIVVSQRVADLKVSAQGIMVGKGEVWINAFEGRSGYWITAINN